jgi:biotin synthase
MTAKDLPEKIRVSIGSAIIVGLIKGKLDANPTTAYLLTYKSGKCLANCGFCPQARGSKGRADLLSRVVWPSFPTFSVIKGIEGAIKKNLIKRVCIQALNYPEVFTHLLQIVREIRFLTKVPISISCQPLKAYQMQKLAEAGVERISIALDAATREIFERVKGGSAGGPYSWDEHWRALAEAMRIFGENNVTTHLIVGLGETEQEMARTIQRCVDIGVYPALFAFTPISGTALENMQRPKLDSYRRIQIARFLIIRKAARYEGMKFDGKGRIIDFGVEKRKLEKIVWSGKPFQTSGCPNCNRPYYNEKPGGPLYNFPKPLTKQEIAEIKKEVFTEYAFSSSN